MHKFFVTTHIKCDEVNLIRNTQKLIAILESFTDSSFNKQFFAYCYSILILHSNLLLLFLIWVYYTCNPIFIVLWSSDRLRFFNYHYCEISFTVNLFVSHQKNRWQHLILFFMVKLIDPLLLILLVFIKLLAIILSIHR